MGSVEPEPYTHSGVKDPVTTLPPSVQWGVLPSEQDSCPVPVVQVGARLSEQVNCPEVQIGHDAPLPWHDGMSPVAEHCAVSVSAVAG